MNEREVNLTRETRSPVHPAMQQIAAHESARSTGFYDRRNDEVSLDEVERIGI